MKSLYFKTLKMMVCLLICISSSQGIAQIQFEEVTGTTFDGVWRSTIKFDDVDEDGDQDVLISGENNSNQRIAKLYTNDGSGSFTEALSTPFDGVSSGSIAFADVDGDSDKDVLITGRNSSSQRIAKLYTNDGSGNFSLVTGTPFEGVMTSSIAFADVDGDNDQDVLITGWNGFNRIAKLYTNDGNGNFSIVSGAPFEGVSNSYVAFADVDSDNDYDVLITGFSSSGQITQLYINDGNGNFSLVSGTTFHQVSTGSIAFADVDGDSDQDVLITGSDSSFNRIAKLYTNDGSGSFTEVTGTPFEGVLLSSIYFADVDADGDEDVLVTGQNSSSQRIAKLYSNNGSGNFTEVTGTPFDGVSFSSIAFSDVDGDGDQDILITGGGLSGRIAKLYQNTSNQYEWTGAVNTDWTNANNWDTGQVPSPVSIVEINSTANQPEIGESDNVEVASLDLEPTAEVKVFGILKVGSRITNNGQIIFKSTATKTGQFDEFTGTYTGTGTVEVERFIPAGDNSLRAFRFLSTAVNSDGSIRENWQEDATSNTDDPNPGFGTHITGSTTGASGFDATSSGQASLLVFDNASQSWGPISDTDPTKLKYGNAYNLFVRGDRSVDLTLDSDTQTPTNTTLRSTGTLATGSLTTGTKLPALASGGSEWSYIGNPYQAIVDFSALTFTGDIKNTILVRWNPNAGPQGSYESIDNTTPAEQIIQPGQSFFVQNSNSVTTQPTIEFTETAKNTLGIVTSVFSTNDVAVANLELYNNNNDVKLDVMKFRFEAGANNGLDDFDAGKLSNPTENLASLNSSTLLSIERRAIPAASDTIALFINQYQYTDYKFQLKTSNWDNSIDVYLKDDHLDEVTLLDANGTISFTVDASSPGSIATDRFSLIFENTTLGVDDNELAEQISLYPNPSNGQFTIKTKSLNSNIDVRIYNMTGKQVFQKSYKDSSKAELNVNAGNLAAGVYMVEMIANKESFTDRLIIK